MSVNKYPRSESIKIEQLNLELHILSSIGVNTIKAEVAAHKEKAGFSVFQRGKKQQKTLLCFSAWPPSSNGWE